MKKTIIPAIVATSLLVSAPAFASDTQSTSTKAGAAAVSNAVIQQQIADAKANGPDWLKRVDISVQVQSGDKPVYSVETVQPIGKQSEHVTTFTQFRLGNDLTAGTVANIGLGKRFLSADKTTMTGVNAFYDYGFKYGHARVGGGLEYFAGQNEYRVNVYHAVSGEKEVDVTNHIFEKALSGADAEIGTSLPNAPWAKLYAGAYTWNRTYSDDERGYKVRTELQLTPQFNLEVGYAHDNYTSGTYYKVMYSIGKKVPAAFEDGKPVFRSADKVTVESKRLDKVRRENDIKVERYQKVDNGPGNIQIVVLPN